ncbi:MAG: DNA replication and repair protein RecF, partial [Rhodomicrobium sp.]
IEAQMAAAAAEIALKRERAIKSLEAEIAAERDRMPDSAFPWAALSLKGDLEAQARSAPQPEIAQSYARLLAQSRERDRAAARTLTGPHRSDLDVTHGPKGVPAKICSTGEQKALMVGLALAQARLVRQVSGGIAPLILLDEIAAHLDEARRGALFSSIASFAAQVWMTGTDSAIFAPLRDATEVQFFRVSDGAFTPINGAEPG